MDDPETTPAHLTHVNNQFSRQTSPVSDSETDVWVCRNDSGVGLLVEKPQMCHLLHHQMLCTC